MQQNICQVDGHNQSFITTICFNTNCKQKRICCLMCQTDFHQDHFDQLVDVNQFLNHIKTQREKPDDLSPQISQVLKNLRKVKDDLSLLQQPISKEIERLSIQSLSKICKDLGSQYNILENQSLENDKFEQLAQNMVKYIGVQKHRIVNKDCFLTKLDQHSIEIMKEFSNKVLEIINEFQQILQLISPQNNNEIAQIQQPRVFQGIHQIDPQKYQFEGLTKKQRLNGHDDIVYGIDICKSRNLLASGSLDNSVKLWNLENGKYIKTYQYSGQVQDVVFSNSGNLLAFGGCGHDQSIYVIDLDKDDIVSELKGHEKPIYRLTFSNNSQYLISGSSDQTVRIWNVKIKKEAFILNSKSEVYGVAVTSDDAFLATNSHDGNIKIWDFQNRNLFCSQPSQEGGCGIQFSNDQKLLVSSHDRGNIIVWNFMEGKISLIKKFKVAKSWIWTVIFSSCSKFIISICNLDNEVKVIDSQTGEIVKIFQSKQTSRTSISDIKISKNMDILAYGEDNNIVILKKQ